MNNWLRVLARYSLSLLFLVVATNVSAAPKKRVLVVHSYHQSQQGHVVEMTEGIEEALSGLGIQVKYYHMDTKRKTSEEWKREAGAQAKAIVTNFEPELVITMDDNAQKYFAKDYAAIPGAPVFVFSGVNKDPKIYGFPAKNVTGVLERPNIIESLEFLKKIVPDAKNILMLSDKSPTTDGFIEYAKSLVMPLNVVAYEQVETFEQWRAIAEKYKDKVDAIGLYVIRTIARYEGMPEKVPETELVAYINKHTKLPTVGFFDSSAQAGILCGISVSMKEQGYAAGELARGILAGNSPDSFAVKPTSKGRIQLNLNTAEYLNINLKHSLIKRADILVR